MLRAFRAKNAHASHTPRADRASRLKRPVRPVLEALEGKALMTVAAGVAVPHLVEYGGQPSNVGSTTQVSSAKTPTQIRQAYGINAAIYGSLVGNGAGQSIAIIDAYRDPNIANDLATFDSAYSLPAPPNFVQVTQAGSTNVSAVPLAPRSSDPTVGTWGAETSLDVEWAHSIAPSATIVLVEANSSSLSDLLAGVSYARSIPNVSVVSMSFGAGEFSTEAGYDSIFTTTPGHKGVTFVASTGDNGAYNNGGSTPAIAYPAASPNVVAVGGTTLNLSNGAYSSETAWSGSGGGVSTVEPRPSYQNSVSANPYRAVPDVSMDADPNTGVSVYDSYDGATYDANGNLISVAPWYQYGGTSLAAPLFAGVIAIGDQVRQPSDLPTLDGPTDTLPLLYGLKTLNYQSNYHDITSGSNGYYSAGQGYDVVTGLGSPVANNLISSMTNNYLNSQAYGGTLNSGQSFTSPNGLFTLAMTTSGNLVEYPTSNLNNVLWNSNTISSGATASMQGDGNLVVYNTAGTPIWYSGTAGNNNAYMTLTNNGQLRIVAGGTGDVLWTTSTLLAGQQLNTNYVITSPNGQSGLLMASSGDLFEFGSAQSPFNANTTTGVSATMGADGRLVVKNASGVTVYNTSAVTIPTSYYGQAPLLSIDNSGHITIWFAGQVVYQLS